MNHLIKKNFLQGGGKKKPKASPATLRPPQLGSFEILNSYNVAEIVDLVSDGPIEGLVNQNGQTLGGGKSILQGIYLNNTPVEVSSSESFVIDTDIMFQSDISSGINSFGDIFFDYATNNYKYFGLPFNMTSHTANILGLFMAQGGLSKSPEYYSPINQGSLGASSSVTNWKWVGDSISSNPRYFCDTFLDRRVEAHYTSSSSLFLAGSLLSSLSADLSSDSNSTNKYTKALAIKASELLNKVKAIPVPEGWTTNSPVLLVVKIGTKSSPMNLASPSTDNSVDKHAGKLIVSTSGEDITYSYSGDLEDVSFDLLNFSGDFPQENIYKILVPEIDPITNSYTGNVYGCLVFMISTTDSSGIWANNYNKIMNCFVPFSERNIQLIFRRGAESAFVSKSKKYNYLNVACELKNGVEYQDPLQNFKNVYVDYDYGTEMFGPYNLQKNIQRIAGNYATASGGPSNPTLNISLSGTEGSVDNRNAGGTMNFSEWNKANVVQEDAIPIVHTIENPNVNSVFFTLSIPALNDTLETDYTQEVGSYKAGDKVPSIVNIEVDWGKTISGQQKSYGKKKYSVIALIDGQMTIDFGSPDLSSKESEYYKSIRDTSNNTFDQASIATPYELPSFEIGEDPSTVKRYLKITKLSAETNSVLVKKDVFLSKVTEIIENDLSYPLSSIIGIKIDARSFGSIPERSYDCRLKKISVPSNCFVMNADGSDKRYIKTSATYTNNNHVYIGDWDGTFKQAWTDNPAWIIYDLLTSKRYGLGSYLDETQINKWELYKIGRFCDAVDGNGYFVGCSDGAGGLEPRYSCNVVFKDQTKIFDAINMVASLFRGIVFFSNSEIHFLDDRPRTPISIFTNTNVKDGFFNYINNRRDQQFNTVEVTFLDRFDNYQVKVEYVQDEEDIRKRGVFKTSLSPVGVTSRAMARRVGQHLIYQTIKENQTVEFTAGLDSLLCRPGDLVIVEDEMKTRQTNYGRILDIDLSAKTLTIDNPYDNVNYTGKITVFTPTGYKTNDEMQSLAALNRSRLSSFEITTGIIDSSDNILTGTYAFSGYAAGYASGNAQNLPVQFPTYTGIAFSGHKLFCYYNTGATGYVFSTGLVYSNNNLYDKIITSTGIKGISDIQSTDTGIVPNIFKTGYRYSGASATKRGSSSGVMFGKFRIDSESYRGVLENEISTVNYPQITTFNITGYQNLNYGAIVSGDTGDININLLQFVEKGSPYRIVRQNASDQIYKIIAIKEQTQNEYSVIASKYNTGKFVEIENFITQDFLPDTYSTSTPMVNGINITQLNAPTIATFTTGATGASNFTLTGTWTKVDSAIGYSAEIYNQISNSFYSTSITDNNITGYGVTGLSILGQWNLRVKSLGNASMTLESQYAKTGKFVAYTSPSSIISPLGRPSITNFTLT